MKLTVITTFGVEYEVDEIKKENDKVYFKRNTSDLKWDYVNPGDVKYIKISENKPI